MLLRLRLRSHVQMRSVALTEPRRQAQRSGRNAVSWLGWVAQQHFGSAAAHLKPAAPYKRKFTKLSMTCEVRFRHPKGYSTAAQARRHGGAGKAKAKQRFEYSIGALLQFANRIRFDWDSIRQHRQRRRDLAEVLQRAATVGHCKRAETECSVRRSPAGVALRGTTVRCSSTS
jgi:hypothetical protein